MEGEDDDDLLEEESGEAEEAETTPPARARGGTGGNQMTIGVDAATERIFLIDGDGNPTQISAPLLNRIPGLRALLRRQFGRNFGALADSGGISTCCFASTSTHQ